MIHLLRRDRGKRAAKSFLDQEEPFIRWEILISLYRRLPSSSIDIYLAIITGRLDEILYAFWYCVLCEANLLVIHQDLQMEASKSANIRDVA